MHLQLLHQSSNHPNTELVFPANLPE
jgi:hypothetical protein